MYSLGTNLHSVDTICEITCKGIFFDNYFVIIEMCIFD